MPARRISAAGLSLVREFESLRVQAYRDPVGILTIGYGHTGPDVKPGQLITVAKAEQLLRDDLATAESAVERFVSVPLNDNQFAALVSLTFNIGVEAFRRSTLRKKLIASDCAAVPAQLARWKHAGGKVLNGLVRRRKAEADLWNTPFVAAAPQEQPTSAHKPAPTVPLPGKPEPAPVGKHGGLTVAFVGIAAALAAAWAWASGILERIF